MVERGCLVPVLLQATGDGSYRLVDGEKRYKAAVLAALTQLPAIVRPVGGAGEQDAAALEGELLVDAGVANLADDLRWRRVVGIGALDQSLAKQAVPARRVEPYDLAPTRRGMSQYFRRPF